VSVLERLYSYVVLKKCFSSLLLPFLQAHLLTFSFIKKGWIDLCPLVKEKPTCQLLEDASDISHNWHETLSFSLGAKRIVQA
jgi:hypothetical protein